MAKPKWAIAARILVIASTLTALTVMATSKETTTLTNFTYQEKYKYWPEFQVFVIGNGIAGVYSFLILLLPPGSELWRLVVFLDVVITALLIAVFSVALSNLYRMKYGNANASWVPICPRVPSFCRHVMAAVYVNIVGIFFNCLLVVYSFHIMTDFLLLQNRD